jgi:putative transcriptional regulator
MTGSVLVAHPNLRDPNFRRTILFLSHHNAEDGAIGLVLNRPLQKTMEELLPAGGAALRRVPVFYGGPVGSEDLLLASMQWHESPGAVSFHGFGNIAEQPIIPPEYQPGLRAFQGYAGWSRGQLEEEIAERSWLIFAPSRRLIDMPHPERAWFDIMTQLGPVYRLLARAPDDPSLN